MQRAVDAVADPHAVGHRLDVDVGGALAHRLRQQQVHDLDDRRLLVETGGGAVGLPGAPLGLARLEDAHVLVDVRGGAVRDVDRALDLADATDVELRRLAQLLPQRSAIEVSLGSATTTSNPNSVLREDDRDPSRAPAPRGVPRPRPDPGTPGAGRPPRDRTAHPAATRGRARRDARFPTRYSPRRWPDSAAASSAWTSCSAVSRPRPTRSSPSIRARRSPPASSSVRPDAAAAIAALMRALRAATCAWSASIESVTSAADAVRVEELVLLDVVEVGVLDRVDVPLELPRGFLAGLQQTHAALFLTSPHPDGGPNALLPRVRVPVGRWRPPGDRARRPASGRATKRRPEAPSWRET